MVAMLAVEFFSPACVAVWKESWPNEDCVDIRQPGADRAS